LFIDIINTTYKRYKKTQFTEKTRVLRTFKFFKNDVLQPNNNYVAPVGVLNCLFEKVYIFQTILN